MTVRVWHFVFALFLCFLMGAVLFGGALGALRAPEGHVIFYTVCGSCVALGISLTVSVVSFLFYAGETKLKNINNLVLVLKPKELYDRD